VSPPAAAAAAAPATRGRTGAPVRPRVAPPRPRRISGPVRPAKRSSRTSSQAQAAHGLVPSLLGALDGVSRSGALDRLIRGRIWIGVITFALIGIVTLQLLVLQLNASIGRSLVREAQLQRADAALSIEGSELAGGERVETQAALLGMQLVPEGSLRFLTDDPRANIARAAAAVKARAHSTSSSGEAGARSTAAGTPVDASGAANEPASTGEAATTAASATSAVGETDPSSTTADAPISEPTGPSTSAASTSTPSEASATTTPSSEAPAAAAVVQAGGVGSGQPNGGG
jgi:hypothetical protein